MNPAAFKILGVSLVAFLATTGLAAYLWSLEERRGDEIGHAIIATAASKEDRTASHELMEAVDDLEALILPGPGETVDFLAFVEDLARRTGVAIEVTSLDVMKTKTKGFDDLSASFLVTGPTAAVEEVLVVFENLPYHSRITSLNLERKGAEAGADLSVVLTVRE